MLIDNIATSPCALAGWLCLAFFDDIFFRFARHPGAPLVVVATSVLHMTFKMSRPRRFANAVQWFFAGTRMFLPAPPGKSSAQRIPALA